MAVTAPRTSASHSPRGSDAAAVNSPQSRRSRGMSSPWTQIVRGGDADSVVSSSSSSVPATGGGRGIVVPPSSGVIQEEFVNSSSDWSPTKATVVATSHSPDDSGEAEPESSDSGNGSGNAAKKPAWNKPSNGAVEVSPVMDAVSWPALSESARASPKQSAADSSKAIPDGSVSLTQGTVMTSPTSHMHASNNTNPNSTNHMAPMRQRSMKQRGGSPNNNVSANGGFSQPPPPSHGLVVEMPPSNSGKPGNVNAESSSRDHIPKEHGQRGGSHGGNDHQQQRSSFRRGNGGPHPRGDGSFHHGYGGRRDLDRGNQDWSRNFPGRDSHMQPQRVVPRGSFLRPPQHASSPFIPPPVPVRPPFGGPMVYQEVAPSMIYVGPPPDPLRPVPIVAPLPPHTVYFPIPDPQLNTKIVNQIDYYFSNENLIKDTFLRQNMDDQGWVPIKLIAGFKKVMHLTDNVQLILDAVRSSTVVEVQGDKVRKRNDWLRWIMPPSVQFSPISSPQSFGRSNHDMLAAHMQSVTLDENTKRGQGDVFLSRSSSGELNNQPQQSTGEISGVSVAQVGFEHPNTANSSN